MISKLIRKKYYDIEKIAKDTETKIKNIISKELNEYEVKVKCTGSMSSHDQVEIIKENYRVVFYLSMVEGSHIRMQGRRYNSLYDNFSNIEIQEIRKRLEKLFI